MCGGGGSGVGDYPTPNRLSELTRQSNSAQDRTDFDLRVNQSLQEVLAEANARDAAALGAHIATVRSALEGLLEETVELRYGGSIRRHTYVDGLSDADLLAVLRSATAADAGPKELIEEFARALSQRLPQTDVSTGSLSVKLRFRDGIEMQVLPAFKSGGGFRIARRDGETWSGVVRPDLFARELTRINQQTSGAAVRAIKLLKVAQESGTPEDRMGGYHIEAIAIRAFENYSGSTQPKAAFLHLVKFASEAVQNPTEETTGQSALVDRDLGEANSPARTRISRFLNRMHRRLTVADEQCDIAGWEDPFRE